MTRGRKAVLVLGVVIGGLWSAAAWAGSDEDDHWQEVAIYNAELKAYKASYRSKLAALDQEIQELTAQTEKNKDRATHERIAARLEPLRVRRLDLMEELAGHQVEAAEQHVVFARRRLALARARLAALKAKRPR